MSALFTTFQYYAACMLAVTMGAAGGSPLHLPQPPLLVHYYDDTESVIIADLRNA